MLGLFSRKSAKAEPPPAPVVSEPAFIARRRDATVPRARVLDEHAIAASVAAYLREVNWHEPMSCGEMDEVIEYVIFVREKCMPLSVDLVRQALDENSHILGLSYKRERTAQSADLQELRKRLQAQGLSYQRPMVFRIHERAPVAGEVWPEHVHVAPVPDRSETRPDRPGGRTGTGQQADTAKKKSKTRTISDVRGEVAPMRRAA